MRPGSPRWITWFSCLLLLTALASGCSEDKTSLPPDEPTSAGQVTAIEHMDAAAKRSSIASGFPVEVPVPAGTVVRGEAQSDSAWNYELVIDAPVNDVAAWYSGAYASRNWTQATGADSGTSTDLRFTKQAAQSRIVLSPEGRATRVIATVGVGTPVLETQ